MSRYQKLYTCDILKSPTCIVIITKLGHGTTRPEGDGSNILIGKLCTAA